MGQQLARQKDRQRLHEVSPAGRQSCHVPNTIGSPEFIAAYAAAIRGESCDVSEEVARKGTVRSAIERYIAECGAFNRLGENARERQC